MKSVFTQKKPTIANAMEWIIMLFRCLVGHCLTYKTLQYSNVLRLLTIVGGAIFSSLLSNAALANVSIEGVEDRALSLEVGKGRMLRFAEPVSSVMVADVDTADVQVVSADLIYLYGKRSGETHLIALDGGNQQSASLRIRINAAGQAAGETLRRLDGSSTIVLSAEGDQLIASGMEESIASAISTQSVLEQHVPPGGSIIDQTTYAGSPQINIRVRFAEVSRDELESYGIDWSALFSSGSFSFGLLTNNNLSGSAANSIGIGYQSGGDSADVLLSALQSNGLVRILAEPNITTVTGETASFLAGGEIPIPVPVNRDVVGIEYRQFGVSLNVSPTLLPNSRISMKVNPEVSSVSFDSSVTIGEYSVPSLSVRRADTVVEVGSGQTFAIAGLFERTDSNQVRQVPMLADVPVLGNLFQSRRFQRNETELVILLTPYIVAPSSTQPPVTPFDQPSQLNGGRGPDSPESQTALHDESFGFHLDTGRGPQ